MKRLKARYRHLNASRLYTYGRGYYDQHGEWTSTGNLYMHVLRGLHRTEHNYEIDFLNQFGREGYLVQIYLCLYACNSRDFKLLETRFGTVGEAAWFIVEFIREYEASPHFEKIVLPEIDKRYRPVFHYVGGQLAYIGDTIRGVSVDIGEQMTSGNYSYYQKNKPDYKTFPRESHFYYVTDSGLVNHINTYGSSWTLSKLDQQLNPDFYERIIQAAARIGYQKVEP